MSKPSARKKQPPRRKPRRVQTDAPRTSDRQIYLGLLIIGGAVTLGAFLVSTGQSEAWRWTALGYLALMAVLMNLFAFRAYRGKKLANWQAALARVPLRFAGYGTKHGKPLTAAHNAAHARSTIVLSLVLSLVVCVALWFVFFPSVLTG
jgi:uncharacterized protein (DUF983 family)